MKNQMCLTQLECDERNRKVFEKIDEAEVLAYKCGYLDGYVEAFENMKKHDPAKLDRFIKTVLRIWKRGNLDRRDGKPPRMG